MRCDSDDPSRAPDSACPCCASQRGSTADQVIQDDGRFPFDVPRKQLARNNAGGPLLFEKGRRDRPYGDALEALEKWTCSLDPSGIRLNNRQR
jgi:hypothetical protein